MRGAVTVLIVDKDLFDGGLLGRDGGGDGEERVHFLRAVGVVVEVR